jgi:hypothetical protein
MNDMNEAGGRPRDLAGEQLAKIDRLSRSIGDTLEEMIADIDAIPGKLPKAILDKLNILHAAHLQVVKAEGAFHDKIGKDPDEDAVDYDAIRSEVGCRLDRLRDSLKAEGIPCDADAHATCDTALSVRLLGTAASDPTAG